MLEFALWHIAHARPMKILAREGREVMGEAAVVLPVAVACEGELAQLVFLPLRG